VTLLPEVATMKRPAFVVLAVWALLCVLGQMAPAQTEVDRLAEALLKPVENEGYGLRVPENDPRLKAIERLTEIGSPEAVQALETFMTTPDSDRQLKQLALVALGKIGTEEAVAAIGRFDEWAKDRFTDPPPFRLGKMDYAIDHFGPMDLQALATARDADGQEWAIFRWSRYGEPDFWLTRSLGEGIWSEPILVDMSRYSQAQRETTYGLAVDDENFTVTATTPLRLVEQTKDTDGDGLADIVEQRLHTRQDVADTDEDGVNDAQDSNPLTPKTDEHTDLTEIRQAVFSVLFATCNSRNAITVVGDKDFANQEYYGYGGVLIKFPRTIGGLVNLTGIEVDIKSPTEATATISDWEGMLAASGHEATLKKLHGRWVVTDFHMTWIS